MEGGADVCAARAARLAAEHGRAPCRSSRPVKIAGAEASAGPHDGLSILPALIFHIWNLLAWAWHGDALIYSRQLLARSLLLQCAIAKRITVTL